MSSRSAPKSAEAGAPEGTVVLAEEQTAGRGRGVGVCHGLAHRRGVVAPPVGGGEEIPGLAGSCDVIGLNYYARMLVSARAELAHPAGGAHAEGDGATASADSPSDSSTAATIFGPPG